MARRLLDLKLRKGDRVAAYGKNSDAYLLLYLGCARAGLVHVPVNFALAGEELAYIVNQSGSRALVRRPGAAGARARHPRPARRVNPRHAPRRGRARRPASGRWAGRRRSRRWSVGDEDLRPAPLHLGHHRRAARRDAHPPRARPPVLELLAALDLDAADRPLHVLPLYHSAQMHVFLMPYLAMGATNRLHEAPDRLAVLREVEAHRITSFFAPPTFWIALLNHPDFARRDLASLRKGYYGASIMPVPVLQQLQARLPGLGFYNCFGQSEIAPLATVLRPEQHAERPDSAGKAVLFVDMRVVDDETAGRRAGRVGEVVYRSPQLCQGYWEKPEETARSVSGRLVPLRRPGPDRRGALHHHRRPQEGRHQHRWRGGRLARGRGPDLHPPAVKEVAVIATPDPKWIEAVTAVVVLKPGAQATAEELVAHARSGSRRSRSRRSFTSWPTSRGTPPARS